jgi:hypothetical protein
MGARALGLALLWCALVLWTGGSSLPMWNALVPALPILFLSIQEGMTAAMDSQRPGLSAITWSAFCTALVASALVSKTPGNVGSIPLASTHFAAMQPSPRAWTAWETPLGRVGLRQEIRDTERLRAIGKFLREELDAEHDVATPWPGAIGYMSRRRVRDLLGRTSSPPGDERRAPWFGSPPRVDLVACLEERPDHVILSLTPFGEAIRDTLHLWLRRWDRVGETPARVQELLAALKDYDLVTVPIEDRAGTSMFTTNAAFFLLRREDIGLDVELDVEVSPSGEFRVLARHDGYEQLANLEIEVVDSDAARWSMRPNGEFTRQPGVSARARVLLHRTGARSIELAAGRIPPSLDARQLRATLRNPGIAERYAFSKIGNEVRVDLR